MEHKDEMYIKWLETEVKSTSDTMGVLSAKDPFIAHKIRTDVENAMAEVGKKYDLTGIQVKLVYAGYVVDRFEHVKRLMDLKFDATIFGMAMKYFETMMPKKSAEPKVGTP